MINWTAGLLKVGEVPSHLAKCECVRVFVRGSPLQLAKYEGGGGGGGTQPLRPPPWLRAWSGHGIILVYYNLIFKIISTYISCNVKAFIM